MVMQSVAAGPPPFTTIVSAGSDTTVSDTIVVGKMAAFPDDEVKTHSDNVANITFAGNALTVLGKSQIKLHENSSELLSGGTVVATTTRFMVRSSCFSAEPVSSNSSRYFVYPYQGRIYIQSEIGELLVKARREMRVPAGKTLAITLCGKPGERVQFANKTEFPFKTVFGGALAGLATVPVLLKNTEPVSAECPNGVCR
jgi:hypothetical protein